MKYYICQIKITIKMENTNTTHKKDIEKDIRYLQLLSRLFPTIASASTEIINLEAILNLPKGTEHFLTDIHGEYEAFQHVLKNASGSIKRKVNEIFGSSLRETEKKELCTLIYYPDEKIQLVKQVEEDIDDWYMTTLNQLVRVCQTVSSKYTRSKVRKSLPNDFSYIIQELLHETESDPNKQAYFNKIITTIISTGRADDFIIAMCNLIQRLTIDSLHIVGDIFDRGPGAHIIMDTLCDYHNVDIQWGNHDLLWMGAAAGNNGCIANVIRISMRYGNLTTLEEGYSINLLPLATFAMDTYANDPCTMFAAKQKFADQTYTEKTLRLIAQMHKAISVIQFKLEGDIIKRHPEYGMQNRLLLDKVDYERGIFKLGDKEYEMLDKTFPTIDPKDPYQLTPEEQILVDKLHYSFVNSEKLQKHIKCLFTYGSMYLVSNKNLLFHASIPLDKNGDFKIIEIRGEKVSGKRLLDKVDQMVRSAYFEEDEAERQYCLDYVWYLWCGKDSPSFDKDKMATFERYFIADKELHKEEKGCYYVLRDREDICNKILNEFGIDDIHSHIINGHVPVKTIKGEQPIKANGKMLVIDGGFSKAYQPETGIAGYTLVFHSRALQLVQHEPFESRQKAIEEGLDIKSNTFLVEFNSQRMMVKDTDKGAELQTQVRDLKKLLAAYRHGLIKEH